MIGVGLMGHGIAWNIAHAGYRLAVLDHPGNQSVDDLRAMGVRVVPRIADVVRAAEIVLLCVTGTPQVEAILTAADGVIAHLRPGTAVVDCSTALPEIQRADGGGDCRGGRAVHGRGDDAPAAECTCRHAKSARRR